MLEVTTMPAWANFTAIAAIFLFCVITWGGKVIKNTESNITLTKAGFKTTYYAFAVLTVVALGALLFMLAPVTADSWLIGIILGILFLAFLVGVLGSMDANDTISHVKLVAGVAITCIIFVVLLFGNAGYAAIWLGSIIAFGFIGHLLFSPNKGEKK
jgi:hypothetical protein